MKEFIEEYGFVILIAIVIITLIVISTLIGRVIKTSVIKQTQELSVVTAKKNDKYNQEEPIDFLSKYVELEYLESTGSQSINIEYVPTEKTFVELEVAVTKSDGLQSIIGSTWNHNGFLLEASSNGNKDVFRVVSGLTDIGLWQTISDPIQLNQKYLVTYGAAERTFSVDGKYYDNKSDALTLVNGQPLKVFRVQGVNSYIRIYSLKIYEDGVLVRNFIPCERTDDNKYGLYDKIENKFYFDEKLNDTFIISQK